MKFTPIRQIVKPAPQPKPNSNGGKGGGCGTCGGKK